MRADVPEQLVPSLGREVRGGVDRPAKGAALVPDEPGGAFLRKELSEQAGRAREASNHAGRAEEAALAGQVGEALACGAVEDERLLTEDVLPVLEERLHLFGVCDRRRGDDRELVRAVRARRPSSVRPLAGSSAATSLARAGLGSKSRTAPTRPPASRRASAGA